MTTPHQPTGSTQHRPLPPSATAYGHHALGLLDIAAAVALSAVKAMLAGTSHTPVTKRHGPPETTPASPADRPLAPARATVAAGDPALHRLGRA